jgi:hypothetical protein
MRKIGSQAPLLCETLLHPLCKPFLGFAIDIHRGGFQSDESGGVAKGASRGDGNKNAMS